VRGFAGAESLLHFRQILVAASGPSYSD